MKILIIEDEVKLATAIARALEIKGHVVITAYDGEVGFQLANQNTFDLLILDSMLPSLNGIEICVELRENKIDIPILILTAKGQISDKTNGLDSGADDYMVKPFSFEELFSRINALLRRAQKSKKQVLKIDDLSLYPSTFKVIRGKEKINLSAKEFALLEYFLKNQGVVITKNQLIQNIWNYNSDILPTTIEVHIKNLRDKIDKKFSKKLIHTVRGFGYTLSEDK